MRFSSCGSKRATFLTKAARGLFSSLDLSIAASQVQFASYQLTSKAIRLRAGTPARAWQRFEYESSTRSIHSPLQLEERTLFLTFMNTKLLRKVHSP